MRYRRLANAGVGEAQVDVRDSVKLCEAIANFAPEAVVHFARLKTVGASAEVSLEYYDNNVVGTLRLLEAMDRAGCRKIVFSSSAAVYGEAKYLPYDEDHPLAPTNPYGRTKLLAENAIRDWCAANESASATLLRYFNPVGAHSSGDIGEDPLGTPENLMPYVAQVATGLRPHLNVFGKDYPTRNGTSERDYIHVIDLALGHVSALDFMAVNGGFEAINIGTGLSYSVPDLVKAFERASGIKVPIHFCERRSGDVAKSLAGTAKAHAVLGWNATRSLDDIC